MDILLQMEAKPVQMRFHVFDSAVIASSKLDYSNLDWAQLFEGRLALNPGLNLNRVSFSCFQKHFLG